MYLCVQKEVLGFEGHVPSSAADFLALQGFCVSPGIPPQKPQKVDYTDLVDFLWLIRAVLNVPSFYFKMSEFLDT